MKTQLVLLTTILMIGCGSSEYESASFEAPAPVNFNEELPEATPTPDDCPTETPTPTPTPVACGEALTKVKLCHVPCNQNRAHWICISVEGAENHLSHHELDYLKGLETGLCD